MFSVRLVLRGRPRSLENSNQSSVASSQIAGSVACSAWCVVRIFILGGVPWLVMTPSKIVVSRPLAASSQNVFSSPVVSHREASHCRGS